MQQSLVIFRQNVRLLLGDPGPVGLFFVTPLLLMAIMRPAIRVVLLSEGFIGVNGSEQVVPGFVVMFTFFWIPWVGRNMIAEHGWGTWERLRAARITSAQLVVGKLLAPTIIIAAQVTLLFVLGAVIFGLHSAGSVAAMALVAPALVACVVALTVMLVGLLSSLSGVDAAGNTVTMLFASLGGSLVPVAALPGWAKAISPITPNHWWNQAARDVILYGKGVSAVVVPIAVLLGMAVLFTAVAAATFRVGDAKVAT